MEPFLLVKFLSNDDNFFYSYKECKKSLYDICESNGFTLRYKKSKLNKTNRIHFFRCILGKYRNGKNGNRYLNCPWR